VAGGRWWGLAGGIAVSAADVIERGTFLTTGTFNNIVLVLIAGGVGEPDHDSGRGRGEHREGEQGPAQQLEPSGPG
jgi:hypothetical protein